MLSKIKLNIERQNTVSFLSYAEFKFSKKDMEAKGELFEGSEPPGEKKKRESDGRVSMIEAHSMQV
jgi:hypothetical protein